MIRAAASISARCENACGKLPEVAAGVGVELLGVEAERRGHAQQPLHQVAGPLRSPTIASAETSQNEQIRNVPSLPDRPSSVSSVR